MPRSRRPSAQTVAVLRALAHEPAAWHYGYELCQQLGIRPGSMYPILMRLADRSLLETAWEANPAPGRPPRHLYRLTGRGREFAVSLDSGGVPAVAANAVPPAGAHPARSYPALGRS